MCYGDSCRLVSKSHNTAYLILSGNLAIGITIRDHSCRTWVGRKRVKRPSGNIPLPWLISTVPWRNWQMPVVWRKWLPRTQSVTLSPRPWRNRVYRSRWSANCWDTNQSRRRKSIWRASLWIRCLRWTRLASRAYIIMYQRWGRRSATWEVA